MKVYELMKALAGMTAGAEVKVYQLLTVDEVTKNGVEDIEHGDEIYKLERGVAEAEEAGDAVYLYTD